MATVREAGAGCPHCAAEIAAGDPVVVCQACGTVHHQTCWGERAGCGSYSCAPARRPEIATDPTEPVLLITQAEIERAIPLRAASPESRSRNPAAPSQSGRTPAKPIISRPAIASLVCAWGESPWLAFPVWSPSYWHWWQ